MEIIRVISIKTFGLINKLDKKRENTLRKAHTQNSFNSKVLIRFSNSFLISLFDVVCTSVWEELLNLCFFIFDFERNTRLCSSLFSNRLLFSLFISLSLRASLALLIKVTINNNLNMSKNIQQARQSKNANNKWNKNREKEREMRFGFGFGVVVFFTCFNVHHSQSLIMSERVILLQWYCYCFSLAAIFSLSLSLW